MSEGQTLAARGIFDTRIEAIVETIRYDELEIRPIARRPIEISGR